MPTPLYFSLLLAASSALASSNPTPSLTDPTVYNNCSGDYTLPLPNNGDSFKPQIRVSPLEIGKNGTGWEEWAIVSHNRLPDVSELIYGFKWSLGEPTSANVSDHAFSAWAHFPNGSFYRQVVRDVFKYEQHADGGFTYSIANNHLTWDPVHELWNASINAGGWIIETHTENVEPAVPFAPNYKSLPGQISDGFFSRTDVPRGHSDGFMVFPWGLNYTIQSVGTLKHTWSNKAIADTVSAYVRGSTFLPNLPPLPIATVNWYQAWDTSGKEIDSMQFLIQPDPSAESQVFRTQITDASEVLNVVTTPNPASLPLSYESTELTLPMCGPGADSENEKMTWKANSLYTAFKFVDPSGGVTLYQKVNMTGVLWFDGAPREFAGGIGIVEVYHRCQDNV